MSIKFHPTDANCAKVDIGEAAKVDVGEAAKVVLKLYL